MTGSKLIVDSALKAAAHLRSSKIPSEVAKSSAALFSAYGGAAPSLPDLKYDYGALERKSIVSLPLINWTRTEFDPLSMQVFLTAPHSTLT